MEEASCISPIIVVPKKNNKLKIYVDFWGFNVITKNNSYLLLFIEEVLDKVVGHEVYSFLDEFFNYHQIMITLKYRYKIAFIID
jgi:hypothetical protein